jgi:hypothetical protein
MAFSPHALLELSGQLISLSGPNEIWTMGLRVTGSNSFHAGPLEDEIEGFLDALVDGDHGMSRSLKDWFADPTAGMSNQATLTTVKLNRIGADGKYAQPGITHVRDFTPVAGGAAPQAPDFLSLVWTYETAKMRGRAHRGRAYPPNPTYAFTGAQVTNALRDANAARGAAFINLVREAHNNDAGFDQLSPVIASRIDGSIETITGVSSDNVYDVQRRRKNQLVPARSAIVAAGS